MSKQNPKYDIIRPEPESLLQSARSFGYTVETAIADLIDNSITANASEIKITYGIDSYSSFVRVEDNGKGMNEKELLNAMRVGSFNPLHSRHENDLGRFGLGLKTASFSQCRRLTVKTRNKSGKEFIRCWDLDVVAKEEDWVLLRDCADKKSEKNLAGFSSDGAGTIVLWEKLDRLVELGESKSDKEHFYRKFDNVRKHLGITFHRFIEEGETSILVNDELIEAVNPFHVSVGVPSTELQEEQLSIRNQHIKIQPYVLPHESKLSLDERKELQIIKGWTEHQGIYLYRNKRLIADGTWLDLNFRKKESQRLCRICIDIPNTLDTEWQIDVKKASAKIPDVIRKRIKSICFSSIEKAIKIYTTRGAYIRRKGQKKEIVYLWLAKQKHGIKNYYINEKHPLFELIADYLSDESDVFKDYMKLIAEAIPVNLIANDFSDPETIIETPLQNKTSALEKIFESALTVLVGAGHSEAEAKKQLNAMEVFQKLNNKA
ncbi:MAG: ATP-binding protein [Bacteroidetes bacterium]|nr:MAG: ATP-binding protein [Bacteroidota bacterium]